VLSKPMYIAAHVLLFGLLVGRDVFATVNFRFPHSCSIWEQCIQVSVSMKHW